MGSYETEFGWYEESKAAQVTSDAVAVFLPIVNAPAPAIDEDVVDDENTSEVDFSRDWKKSGYLYLVPSLFYQSVRHHAFKYSDKYTLRVRIRPL
ncbi:hypothetical protein NEOLEDRAFT_1128661 [Neolentinus lepideus HHB14362 ss-1]|uniref:Uncharacterized protein n=1 Tax=Neolentinus lepideus HHB14362 ss-1 TaxID=1314782 RepID=A0A165V3G4_9AGAM|nr:hypothetical protein NEOLEDRAFT_1128661 [Neolentinus lepideus HHB14362 ss-1]